MFAAGVGFYPDDNELVFYYLKNKVSGSIDTENFRLIREIDLYNHEPSELPGLAHDSGHSKLYFFTRLERKHQQGTTIKTQTPGGCWVETGQLSFIEDEAGARIARKTSLYYKRDRLSDRSEEIRWLMKEYVLVESQPINQNDEESNMLTPWTLCVVYPREILRKNRRKVVDND